MWRCARGAVDQATAGGARGRKPSVGIAGTPQVGIGRTSTRSQPGRVGTECQIAPLTGSGQDKPVLLSRRSLAATSRSGSRLARCGVSDRPSAEDIPAFIPVSRVGSAAKPRKAASKRPNVSQGHQSRCRRRCLLDDVRVISGNSAIRFNSGAFAPSFRGPDAAFYWRRLNGSMFQRR